MLGLSSANRIMIKHRFSRGDIIFRNGQLLLVRYSHQDMHGWCQLEEYKLALVRGVACPEYGHSQQEYEQGGYPCGYVELDHNVKLLAKVDEKTTKRIELYAGQNLENDQYRAKASLTLAEWQEYINLIDRFAAAKTNKQYEISDQLRQQLMAWQEYPNDFGYVEMAKAGKYIFHPAFRRNHP